MAVSASKLVNRDIYEVTYENSTGEGQISAEFENPADGDKSAYTGLDDGQFIVSVMAGYQGEADLHVKKDGELIDSGRVTFEG
jgi:hypothetical protein